MDLELAKIQTYHDLKSYHEEVKITIAGGDAPPVTLTGSTYKDGAKFNSSLTGSDGNKAQHICDGAKSWLIYPAQKAYEEAPVAGAFDPKSVMLRTPELHSTYSATAGLPVRFSIDPYPILQSDEVDKSGAEPLRKLVFLSHNSGGRSTTLTQWFLPDRWILKRFEFKYADKDHPIDVTGEATVIDFTASAPQNEYDLAPSLVEGFSLQPHPKPEDYSHPTSFHDFEIAKILAYHDLDNFHEEVEATMADGTQTTSTRRSHYQDGFKERDKMSVGDYKLEVVSDGTTSWTIVPSTGTYTEYRVNPMLAFDAKSSLLTRDERGFNYQMTSGMPVLFAFNPEPTLESDSVTHEGGSDLRKVVFNVTGKSGKKATLVQWFLPDKMLLKRFQFDVDTDTGHMTMKGEVTMIPLTDPDRAIEFILDPALTKGLRLTNNSGAGIVRTENR